MKREGFHRPGWNIRLKDVSSITVYAASPTEENEVKFPSEVLKRPHD